MLLCLATSNPRKRLSKSIPVPTSKLALVSVSLILNLIQTSNARKVTLGFFVVYATELMDGDE